MRTPKAVCNAVLAAFYFGVLYGGSVATLTDMALAILYGIDAAQFEPFSTSRFWISSGIGSGLHLAYLPAFKWAFMEDAFRLHQSRWKMSLKTFYLLILVYPLLIHTGTEVIMTTKYIFFLERLLFSCPSAAILTLVMEGGNVFTLLRHTYLQELAF